MREMCGEICCAPKVATKVCGKCAGNFAVFKRWQNTCAGHVRGILLCSKGGKTRVQEMCGETWFAHQVAQTCAGDVLGILMCSKDGK